MLYEVITYRELQAALPTRTMVNIDETGHPENGKKLWTWGFHTPGPDGFTLFHIDHARSSEVLLEFLGETFAGVVGCDYHSAYVAVHEILARSSGRAAYGRALDRMEIV